MSTNVFPTAPRIRLRERWRAHFWLKTVTIPGFYLAFFAGYFHLLRHPLAPLTILPLTWVDRLAGFHPWALGPYVSLWIYVTLPPSLVRGWREISAYSRAVAFMTAVGFGTFLLWPTAVPPLGLATDERSPLGFLKALDASGNACPSLHVAFAAFTAIWIERWLRGAGVRPRWRALNGFWSLAIVYSTLATKQHVLIDVLAGGALGGAAGLIDPRPAGRALVAPESRGGRFGLALGVCAAGKLAFSVVGAGVAPPLVAAVWLVGPDLWILAGWLLPNVGTIVPTATRFATARREVWLTIDDGPEPATTAAMLDLLDRHGAKATFFVIGQKAAARPALVREIARRGHTLGNHTQTHPLATFWLASPGRTALEVDAAEASLRRAGVTPAGWLRTPAGLKTLFLRGVLAARGCVLIGWSARGREAASRSIDGPLRRLKRGIRPGAILLVHESGPHAGARCALLTALLEHLAAEGYRCVLPERASLR